MPTGDRVVGVGDPAEYYTAFLENPTPAIILYWLTAFGGFVGIPVVLAFSERVEWANKGWVSWTKHMSVFGFAVKAVDSLRGLTLGPMRARAWVAGDASTRAAIGATRLTFDYHGWMTFGAVGVWVFVVALLFYRHNNFPKWQIYLGITASISYLLLVAGFTFENVLMLSIGVGLGCSFGAVWFIWIGALCFLEEGNSLSNKRNSQHIPES